MIADNDREDAENIAGLYTPYDCDEMAAGYVSTIRAESAEQARKEAAERVAYAWREHGEDITLRIIHDAILSTVNESFTVAPISTDAEKLAIAVKALEEASTILSKTDGDYDALCVIRQALKEIQG